MNMTVCSATATCPASGSVETAIPRLLQASISIRSSALSFCTNRIPSPEIFRICFHEAGLKGLLCRFHGGATVTGGRHCRF